MRRQEHLRQEVIQAARAPQGIKMAWAPLCPHPELLLVDAAFLLA